MRVHLYGNVDLALDGFYKLVGVEGLEESGHILDTDGIRTEVEVRFRELGIFFVGVVRRSRERNRHLDMFAGFLGGLCGALEVPGIVERIEDAEHTNTVIGCGFNELVDNVVGIVAVAKQVLSAEEHHDRSIGELLLEGAEAVPRIFVQEADTGVEGRSAPGFEAAIADFIEHGTCGKHVLGSHTGCLKGLMRVAEDEIRYGYFPGHEWSPYRVCFALSAAAIAAITVFSLPAAIGAAPECACVSFSLSSPVTRTRISTSFMTPTRMTRKMNTTPKPRRVKIPL